MLDYLKDFPISAEFLPARFRALLEPIGIQPSLKVDVGSFTEHDLYGPTSEIVLMAMAVVPDDVAPSPVLYTEQGLVAYSVPELGEKGTRKIFTPGINGYDYIVASWGSGLFYTYNLAEKVWMALGLTPRCIGNEQQRIIYDDPKLPEFAVAEGEISSQFYFKASRNVRWTMSNEYLRKYLWLRGARGVRQFYYQAMLPDSAFLKGLVGDQKVFVLGDEEKWFNGDLRKDEEGNGYLLQVWATVEAVSCQLCPTPSAEKLIWPGIEKPITTHTVRNDMFGEAVYLSDRFLEKYEQNSLYDSTPAGQAKVWYNNPSYSGQWAFSGCLRVGRNLIRVPIRELYSGVPTRELLHAHSNAVLPEVAEAFDKAEEHVVSLTDRFAHQLLALGRNLSALAGSVGIAKAAQDIVGLSDDQIKNEGWWSYPYLARLAHVAPLEMTQREFLSRCKSIHEVYQRIPDDFLRKLLQAAGVPRDKLVKLKSLKLLEALMNVLTLLDAQEDPLDAFSNEDEPEGWNNRNSRIAMLFVASDLRNAYAHDSSGAEVMVRLQDQGFDTASLSQGHGLALDVVFKGVIEALIAINHPLHRILARA